MLIVIVFNLILPCYLCNYRVNTSEEELIDLQFTLGEYIRKEFRLNENDDLMESCCFVSKVDEINIGHASFTIIMELWKKLQMSCSTSCCLKN